MRLCLAMIVKNEAHVVARALTSCAAYIDAWVVCDTGSTDATREIVRDTLQGIPGQVYEDPWVDFAHNRTLSLQRAAETGCAYTLILDADEILQVRDPACFAQFTGDAYLLRGSMAGETWLAERVIKSSLPWRYINKIHENLDCPEAKEIVLTDDPTIIAYGDGRRSLNPDKLTLDVQTMENCLLETPDNARMVFHLAKSYEGLGRVKDAVRAYERRLTMEGFDLEEWYSRLRLGELYLGMGYQDQGMTSLLEAYSDFPQTAEPLYYLGKHYFKRAWYEQALPYLELAATKNPPDQLFVREDTVYTYEAALYWALCLLRLDRPEDANRILLDLSHRGVLPEGAVDDAQRTLLESFAEAPVGAHG